jgi:hypothetical protein
VLNLTSLMNDENDSDIDLLCINVNSGYWFVGRVMRRGHNIGGMPRRLTECNNLLSE